MTKILMLLAQNDINTDPRVSKAFQSATDHGYEVKVCCYMRYDESVYSKNVDRIRMLFSRNIGTYKKIKDAYVDEKIRTKVHKRTPLFGVLATLVMLSIHPVDIFFKSKYFKPDIVHVNDLNTLLSGVMFKIFCGSKLIYDSHELWVDMIYAHPLCIRKAITWYEKFLIQYADEVITVNNLIAKELVERYGILTPHVVMNVPYLQSVNLEPHTGVKVIYQGKYDSDRYLENVVRGAQYFLPGITLTMRGVGDYGETLKKCVQSNNVEFIPPVTMDKLVQSLSGFDIGVATGAYKQGKNGEFASPNKMFEYMMAGLAVVGNTSPVIQYMITTSDSGIVFDGGNPKDFARAINEIASDTVRMNEMKRNGIVYTTEHYCWEKEQAKLITVYNTCELS